MPDNSFIPITLILFALLLLAMPQRPMAADPPENLRTAPLMRGTLWWIVPSEEKPWARAELEEAIDTQMAAGFDVLWIFPAPLLMDNALTGARQGILEDVYELADAKGLKVIADLPKSGWYGKTEAEEMIRAMTDHADVFYKRYGSHVSFFGWYFNHEINPIAPEDTAQTAFWRKVWKSVTDHCRRIAPETVTTISPFFLLDAESRRGFICQTPREWAGWWGDTLRETGIGIMMPQDSGEHLSFFTLEDRAPFLAAIAEECRRSGVELWINAESGEAHVPDWDTYLPLEQEKAVPWRFTPMDWLAAKLRLAAEHGDGVINWGYFPYMDPHPAPAAEIEGQAEAYRAYLAYYEKRKEAIYRERARISLGNTRRLQRVMAKARNGEKIVIGAIGGSITRGAHASAPEKRWANRVAQWWRDTFPEAAIELVNAGIGATGSGIGAHRTDTDLLKHKPDVVLVEFAVNDTGNPVAAETLEGLLRQILKAPEKPAAMMLFTMNENGANTQKAHTAIGRHYRLPMASLRDGLWPEIAAGNMQWQDIAADEVHPNDKGHAYCADFLIALHEKALDTLKSGDIPPELPVPAPLISDTFEHTALLNAGSLTPAASEGWRQIDGAYGPGWESDSPGSELVFEVEGTAIGLVFYRIKGAMGIAEAWVDEGASVTMDAWFNADWGGYTPFQLIARDREPGKHRLHIRLLEAKNPGSSGHRFQVHAVTCAGLK
jgi:lysophospholipase L1-like esterase